MNSYIVPLIKGRGEKITTWFMVKLPNLFWKIPIKWVDLGYLGQYVSNVSANDLPAHNLHDNVCYES